MNDCLTIFGQSWSHESTNELDSCVENVIYIR